MSTSPEQPTDQEQPKNTYVLDPESAVELARLMRQDRLITQGMGGVFPEKLSLDGMDRILDLACGPGSWALDVAFAYQDMEVVGVDISESMIRYANARAQAQQRDNASFEVMNVLEPFTFPDNSFDLINARFISGFMRRELWSHVFTQCLRVLRPGGIFRLTEVEMGMSNKPSFEKCFSLIYQAVTFVGGTFSPAGLNLGVIQMLPRFFRQAGLQEIGKMAHAIDFSAGTEICDSFYHNLTSVFYGLEPLIVKMKLLPAEEWRELSQKALAEMFEEDFCAMWTLLTVWGRKPV